MTEVPLRIAMWSPPRARSTMAMRVFEALGCAVLDEPFYAYWLKATKREEDPGYAATLAAHEIDWQKVEALLLGPVPGGKAVWYQKHMAIHMLPEISLAWMGRVRNCFLIRDPAEIIASMTEFRGLTHDVEEGARLVGIPQLARIFDEAWAREGQTPLVIDANDLLADPPGVLSRFCAAVGIPFDPARPITWAPGKHEGDGAWADVWYQKVYQTTGLGPYTRKETVVPKALEAVVARCQPTYDRIAAHRLQGGL
ncbi:MAG: hypothetical protein ACPF9T_08995 [Pseudomonadales bacterium]